MIKIYSGAVTDFEHWDISVEPIKAEVFCDDNMEYYYNIEIPLQRIFTSGEIIDYTPYFVKDNIVMVNTPSGEQPFRIDNPEKTSRSFKSKAYHVFCDLKKYVIPTKNTELYSLNGAIQTVFTRANIGADFTFTITASSASNYFMVTLSNNTDGYKTMTAFDALLKIAKMWNAQIVVDKFNIKFRDYPSSISPDVVLKNAKNISDITITENWDNVCTKCIAIGYRDLRNSYANISTYLLRYDRVVSFSPSDGVDTAIDAEVIADLGVQSEAYVNANLLPKINYNVNATMDAIVNVGDPIAVKHSKLNVDIITSVISYTWNALTSKYTNVEFGNFKPKIKSFATIINKQIRGIQIRLSQGGL